MCNIKYKQVNIQHWHHHEYENKITLREYEKQPKKLKATKEQKKSRATREPIKNNHETN
jgi:fatty acid desaturase